MNDEPGDRGALLAGVAAAVLCLAYFYLVDRFIFSSAHFAPIFSLLLTVDDPRSAWLSVAVCVAACAWKRPTPVLVVVDFVAAHAVLVSIAVAVALGFGNVFVYHGYALSMDEYAALFQAKIFAAGHLYAQLPTSVLNWLILPGFNGSFLIASHSTGEVVEGYWPGFAMLLAPFEFLGVPWACNALLACAALLLINEIAKLITGEVRAGAFAVLFTIASSTFAANAISYYSMQAHLTLNLLFAWLLMRPTPKRTLLAGLVGSVALILHNPFPHFLFALPWLLYLLIDKSRWRTLGILVAGYVPGFLIGLSWWYLKASILPPSSASAALPISIFKWPDAQLLNMRMASLAKLVLWAMPALFIFAAIGFQRCRKNRHVTLLAWSALLTFAGYMFVNLDQGHGWGYRYFHSAWPVIAIFAGCAMQSTQLNHRRLVPFGGALVALSLLLLVPFQLSQIENFIAYRLAKIPAPLRPGNNVYFIDPEGGFYSTDLIQIDPLLREPDLLLASRGALADLALVKQNWPQAVIVKSGNFGIQWYLGPIEQRVTNAASKQLHFELQAPSAALLP